MYHYSGKPMKEKVALADCIDAVLKRGPITSTGEAPIVRHNPITYDLPEIEPLMVAESPVVYGEE
jgi:hypothetical protein